MMRFQNDFEAIIFFRIEQVVRFCHASEGKSVRDDVIEKNFFVFHKRQELINVTMNRRLARAQSDSFVEDLTKREIIIARAINADD